MSRDQWWFDYIENEVDAATRSEMKSLLRHSPKDQELVKSISDTKTFLKEGAEPLPQITEDALDDLHDRIMASIEPIEIKAKPRLRLRHQHRRLVKTLSLSTLLLVASLSLVQYFSKRSLNTAWDISQQIAQQGQENPEDLALLMAYQNEQDFFVDVASLSLDHLTKEQFESLLEVRRTR